MRWPNMNRERIILIVLALSMLVFTAVLDIYVIHVLGAIDNLGAIVIGFLNISTISIIYIIITFLSKKETKIKID